MSKSLDNKTAKHVNESWSSSEEDRLDALIKGVDDPRNYRAYLYGPEDLSFSCAIALVSLARSCDLNEDGTYGPLGNNPIPFAPQGSLTESLLIRLISQGLIGATDNSLTGAIHIDDDKNLLIDFDRVTWKVYTKSPTQLISQIEDRALYGNWPERWMLEVESIRLELALAECKEFYEYAVTSRGLPYADGVALETMLLNLLRDHSVAQCYRVIWAGARLASDFKARNKANSKHAANFMIGACQRWADRARAEGWNTIAYQRNFDLPRSMVSYVLYDVMLKIGERGFTELVSDMKFHSV